MKLLAQYQQLSKIIHIEDDGDLYDTLESIFSLCKGSYILKVFDEDFNEYVDVEDTKNLKNKDKLKLVDKLQIFDNSLNFSSAEYEVIAENNETNNTPVAENIVLPLKQQNFPLIPEVPVNRFSPSLLETLEAKLPLSWDKSRELVGHLANYLYSFRCYPNKFEREAICAALLQMYPYLSNGIGNGTGSWEARINNKLKKRRQGDNCVEVSTRKSECLVSGRKTPQRIPSKSKKGELNWAPDHCPGENEQTQSMHVQILQEEFSKSIPFQNKMKVKSLMALTYSFRRILINNNASTEEILDKYPFLSQKVEQFDEFTRLTAVQVNEFFFENVLKSSPKLYNVYKQRFSTSKNLESSLIMSLKAKEENLSAADKIKMEAAFGLRVLPVLLKENSDAFFKVVTVEEDTPPLCGIGHPIIFSDEEVGSSKNFTIAIEGRSVLQVNCFLEAVCLLMCFYYTLNIQYPKELHNTLMFLQNYFFNIYSGCIPPKCVTLKKKML